MPAKWDAKLKQYTTTVAEMNQPKEPETPSKTVIVNPGTPIRIALAFEAVTTFAFATYLLMYPKHAVSQLAATPKYTGPLAETLVQFLAIISYGIVLALGACIPQTRLSVNLRAPVYTYLGAIETMLIALFAWMEYSKGEHITGVSEPVTSFMSWNFAGLVGWRVLVLTIMPEWLGSVEEVKKEE